LKFSLKERREISDIKFFMNPVPFVDYACELVFFKK